MSRAEWTRTLPPGGDPAEPSAAQPRSAAREMGPYVISGEIARGGLGRVLEAWDTRLGRAVALKEPIGGGRVAQARFAREAKLTARLQHPGVVPIYEAGTTPDGEPYYAMRFVSGGSLRDAIAEQSTLAGRLGLLSSVIAAAETIAYAHSRSILHRDLKPANILVGAFGETVVIDWGLGKLLDDPEADAADSELLLPEVADGSGDGTPAPDITLAGTVLGTPAFMPPEQARGEPVDERADVYALGAILYNLLAGVAPYASVDVHAHIDAVRAGPPERVAKLAPDAPPDLVAIVEQAMARDRERRYTTAAQLVSDLRRYVTGQLVGARHYSPLTLARRWLRRHAWATAIAVTALVGVIGVRQLIAAQRSAELSQERAVRTDHALNATVKQNRQQQNAIIASEAEARVIHDPAQAIIDLTDYPADGADWSRVTGIALEAARLGLPDRIFHVGNTAKAAFSSDGNALAIVTSEQVAIADPITGAVRHKWPIKLEPFDKVDEVIWRGARLVIALRNGAVLAFDSARGRRDIACLRTPMSDVAADAETVIAGGGDGTVARCSLDTGRSEVLQRHHGAVTKIALTAGRAFSVGRDGVITASALDGPARLHRDLGLGGLRSIAVRDARGGIDLAVGTEAGDLLLVDAETLRTRRRLRRFAAPVVELLWNTQHDAVVVRTTDHKVRLVSASDGSDRPLGDGIDVVQSPGGEWLALAGGDGAVTLVHPSTEWRRTLKAHGTQVVDVSLAPDGRLVTIGFDQSLRLWGRANVPERVYALDGIGSYLDTLPGRDEFAFASDTGQLQLCDYAGNCRTTRLPMASQTLLRLGATDEPLVAADLARGVIHLFDRSLAPLGRLDAGEPLRDVRVRGGRFASPGRTTNIVFGDLRTRSVDRVAIGSICERPTRIRWLSETSLLVGCQNGAIVTFDLVRRAVTSTDRVTDVRGQPGLLGLGNLRDGSLLALLESGEIYRLGAARGRLLACAAPGMRLFEAAEGGAWLSDCGSRVRVLNGDGAAVESVAFARGESEVNDMDASVERGEIAVVFIDRVVLWSPDRATIKLAGTGVASFNVEVGDRNDRVLTASPGSIQLWDLTTAHAVPTDHQALRGWLAFLANRYRAE